jgi:hypothetical protein
MIQPLFEHQEEGLHSYAEEGHATPVVVEQATADATCLF